MDRVALPEQVPIPEGALPFWVIYERPTDFPDGYVLRVQLASREGIAHPPYIWHAKTPDELRSILPPGLICMGRQPDDAPQILECWM